MRDAIKPLVVIFVAAEVLDYLTYLVAPHLEANPAMAGLQPHIVGIAKTVGVILALLIIASIKTPRLAALALGCGIAIGAFGLGANVASLSMVLR